MAMHEPSARIVGDKGHNQIASGGKHGDVAARRVLVGESGAVGVDALAGAEHIEVVAMEMD